MHVRSDQVAASEDYGCALGVAVVGAPAEAIGVTAVPTPDTDRGSDLFFVYAEMMNRFNLVTAAGFESINGMTKDVDSKAMRKVEDGDQVVIVQETQTTVSSCVVTVAGRMLIKLH